MTKQIKEDFCATCAVAAGFLFAGSGTAAAAGTETDEEENKSNNKRNILIGVTVSLFIIALLIFLYGKFFSSCKSCRI